MNKYVIIFCIVATVFAIATLIYVVGSMVKGIYKRAKRKRARQSESGASLCSEGVLLVTGLLCAASGLLLGYAITKDRDDRSRSSAKFPFKR